MPGSRRHAGKVQDSILLCRSMPDTVMERDTAVLAFIGDVMLHRAQIENACREDGSFDFSGYFSGIQDDLRKADIAVANMEFTLAGEPYTGYPAFSAPDSYAEYMAGCGIDVFLTANNHILDKGRKGLLRTLSVYREMERKYGIRMTGSAETVEEAARVFPLMMNVNGIKIAFVNFTYGTNIRIPERFPGTFLMDKEQIQGHASCGKGRSRFYRSPASLGRGIQDKAFGCAGGNGPLACRERCRPDCRHSPACRSGRNVY